MSATRHVLSAVFALALAAAATLPTAPAAGQGGGQPNAESRADLALLERPGQRLERSIEAHLRRVAEREARREARRAARQEAHEAQISSLGVSRATLESIAACESGGDPGAVNGAGYYGKYQFDLQTWQSVGGSGNPADADEAEQDYRAALLYSRAGASPWPVCGS